MKSKAEDYRDKPVSGEELATFIEKEKEADFLLELQCLRKLAGKNYHVSFAGLYDDPMTQKVREFDLRAQRRIDDRFPNLYLTVECKNLSEARPILAFRSEATFSEALMDVLIAPEPDARQTNQYNRYRFAPAMYAKEKFFGRSLCQVFRTQLKGNLELKEIGKGQNDIESKWQQSIASMTDWITDKFGCSEALTSRRIGEHHFYPCLVVPDHTLWIVSYDDKGVRQEDVHQGHYLFQHLGKSVPLGKAADNSSMWLSKMHIYTISGFSEFLNQLDEMRAERPFEQ